jgi:uncharacterized membrane protein
VTEDSRSRRLYLDWARGVAVLLMIEAHTFDAWTRPASRHGAVWNDLGVLAGFAAPAFLWLAGVGVALSAAAVLRRTGSRAAAVDTVCRRGLEIFILAFLFRLQAFIVSPGSHPVTLFRVDILNIMGPAIAVAGLVWGIARTTAARVTIFAAIAAAITLVTPFIPSLALIDALPVYLQWQLRWTGEFTTFSVFPWTGFLFAGAAVGALIASARDESSERIVQLSLAIAGSALVAAGFYTASLPSIYRESSFWSSSPTWFAIRVGIMLLMLVALAWAERLRDAVDRESTFRGFRVFVFSWPAALARVGRSSLFIYWIHIELVYGYATYNLWKALPLWGTAVAYAAFCAAMYGAVVLRDRVVDARRLRRSSRPSILASSVAGQA